MGSQRAGYHRATEHTQVHTHAHVHTRTHTFIMPQNALQPDPLAHVEEKHLPSVTTCVALTFYLIEQFLEVWGRAALFMREHNYRCWLLRGCFMISELGSPGIGTPT